MFLHCILGYENSLGLPYPAVWEKIKFVHWTPGFFLHQKLFHSLSVELKALNFWKRYVLYYFMFTICLNTKCLYNCCFKMIGRLSVLTIWPLKPDLITRDLCTSLTGTLGIKPWTLNRDPFYLFLSICLSVCLPTYRLVA